MHHPLAIQGKGAVTGLTLRPAWFVLPAQAFLNIVVGFDEVREDGGLEGSPNSAVIEVVDQSGYFLPHPPESLLEVTLFLQRRQEDLFENCPAEVLKAFHRMLLIGCNLDAIAIGKDEF